MGIKFPYITEKEGENPWVTYLKHQVNAKNNCINAIYTGETGSGKSWNMLSLCQALDPDFALDGNWFFKAGELFKEIKSYYVDRDMNKRGKIWMYDEAGIDLNNLKFHDEVNKGFNAFFQTARHRNYILGMSVPFLSFISKGVRTLMKTSIRADGWTKDNECRSMPRYMEYNGDINKFYYKRLMCKFLDGSVNYIGKMLLPSPTKKLIVEYESLKKEFTSDLFTDVCARINRFEIEKNVKIKKENSAISLTLKQSNVLNFLKDNRNCDYIAEQEGVGPGVIYAHVRAIKRKGIEIIGIKDKQGRVNNYKVVDPRDLNK